MRVRATGGPVFLSIILVTLSVWSGLAAQDDEGKFRFKFDVGYRWQPGGLHGSLDLYRSQLDYGEGPKLFSADFFADALPRGSWFFDQIEMRMNSWGGEPYNTAHVRALRKGFVDLRFDYQNVRYFNAIPAFANPFFEEGNLVSQHRSDFSQRYFRLHARFRPGRTLSPFLSYERSSRQGPVRTTLAADGDEFQVVEDTRDHADDLKFGFTWHKPRVTFLLQQGIRWYRDSSRLSTQGPQDGNSLRFVFGESIDLTDYAAETDTQAIVPVSTASVSVRPLDTLSAKATVSYGIATLDSSFSDRIAGNFFSFPPLGVFYASGRLQARSEDIKKPNLVGDFSAQWQPLTRFRVVERFRTRRFHVSGAALLLSALEGVRPILGGSVDDPLETTTLADSFVFANYDRQELQGVVQVTSALQLSVGHRYESREVSDRREFHSRRNVLLLGGAYRFSRGNRVSLDYELGRTDDPIFRLDSVDFERLRISGQARPFEGLDLSGTISILSDQDAVQSIDFQQRDRDAGFHFDYQPASRVSVSGGFQRSRFRSSLLFVLPQTFERSRSFFRERANFGEVWTNVVLVGQSSLSLGYTVWQTSGTFPVRNHRPAATLEIPVARGVVAYGRWNYHGYREDVPLFPQSYRTHLAVVGLRVSLDNLEKNPGN